MAHEVSNLADRNVRYRKPGGKSVAAIVPREILDAGFLDGVFKPVAGAEDGSTFALIRKDRVFAARALIKLHEGVQGSIVKLDMAKAAEGSRKTSLANQTKDEDPEIMVVIPQPVLGGHSQGAPNCGRGSVRRSL